VQRTFALANRSKYAASGDERTASPVHEIRSQVYLAGALSAGFARSPVTGADVGLPSPVAASGSGPPSPVIEANLFGAEVAASNSSICWSVMGFTR
jgi:hypothetical protein